MQKSIKAVCLSLAAASTLAFTGLAQASQELAQKSNCLACHQVEMKLVGPSYKEIAAKYQGDAAAAEMLRAKVKAGGAGVWGPVPMPPNAHVSDEDIATLVDWVLAMAGDAAAAPAEATTEAAPAEAAPATPAQ